MNHNTFEWITLDNAAKVFPGQNIRNWANVFRVSVKLNESIEPEILKEAIENTFKRIPTLRVRIKKGFFWHYFEYNSMELPLRHDIKNFCYRVDFKENNGYLLRVYYHGCHISVDIYHSLCDGHGGAVFLSTLAGEYLRLKGTETGYNQFVLDTTEAPRLSEQEDAYIRYKGTDTKTNLVDTFVYHKKGTRMPAFQCNYTSVSLSFNQLHSLSKSYGVTVTEFLAAVLMDVHYRKMLSQGKRLKEISVQIPVNLRKFFPSESLRNFVLCVLVKIDPRKRIYTFEEIVETVSSQLRTVNNKKAHHAYITRTVKVGAEAIKLLPLALKTFIIRTGFTFGAEYSTTALFSNLGPVSLPESMSEHIDSFSFYTGPGLVNGARCGAASLGDRFVFTFSNIYKEDDIESEFMKKLTELGLSVTVETNRETDFTGIEGVVAGTDGIYSEELFIPCAKDRTRLNNPDISFSEKMKRVFHL